MTGKRQERLELVSIQLGEFLFAVLRHSRDWPRFERAFARWGAPDVELRGAAISFMLALLMGIPEDGEVPVTTPSPAPQPADFWGWDEYLDAKVAFEIESLCWRGRDHALTQDTV